MRDRNDWLGHKAAAMALLLALASTCQIGDSLASSFTSPIFDDASYHVVLGAVPDGSDGAIVVWSGQLVPLDAVFAQRVTQDGTKLWGDDGLRIPTPSNDDAFHVAWVFGDGAGGLMVVWQDLNADWPRPAITTLRAQRINSAGQALWDTLGVPLCTAPQTRYGVKFVADGSGGGLFAWMDHRNGEPVNSYDYWHQWRSGFDVFAQRIDAAGNTAWGPSGKAIRDTISGGGLEDNYFYNEPSMDMVSDGAGGAFLAWADRRNLSVYGRSIYAQHLDSSGNAIWPMNGVSVYSDPDLPRVYPRITRNGNDGVIVTWLDERGPGWYHVYAQKLDANGSRLWNPSGVPVSPDPGNHWSQAVVSDGNGGAIISWGSASTNGSAAYVQHLDVNGIPQWPSPGVRIAESFHVDAQWSDGGVPLLPDGTGGVLCAVTTGSSFSSPAPLAAQHVGSDGTPLWGSGGVPLPSWPSFGNQRPRLVPAAGGMFVFWSDGNIYGTYVGPNGFESLTDMAGQQPISQTSIAPNPLRTSAELSITLSAAGRVHIAVLDPQGRVLRHLIDGDESAGWHRVAFDGKSDDGGTLRSGVYFLRVQAPSELSTKAFVILR